MTTEDHDRLQQTISRAKSTAASSRQHIAVIDVFYVEYDHERFNYCPTAALTTLYHIKNGFALVGIAYPNGQFLDAATVVDELERAAR